MEYVYEEVSTLTSLVLLCQMESQRTILLLYLSFPFVLCFSLKMISTRETYQ